MDYDRLAEAEKEFVKREAKLCKTCHGTRETTVIMHPEPVDDEIEVFEEEGPTYIRVPCPDCEEDANA